MSDSSLLQGIGIDVTDAEISVEQVSETPELHGRSLARSQALQLLFQAEATGRTTENVLASKTYTLSEGPLDPYAEKLALGCAAKLDELDARLDAAAQNWSVSRMSATDRNLLRLALYEILYVDEVDPAVAINECVELAKIYSSSEDSPRFVNGILGRVVKDAQKTEE